MGDLITIERESLPADLGERLTDYANVRANGDLSLLCGETLGLLCSRKCPGRVILKFFDLLSD